MTRKLSISPLSISNNTRSIALVEDKEGNNTYVRLDSSGIKEEVVPFREKPLSNLSQEELAVIKEMLPRLTDQRIEKLWEELEDVSFNEDEENNLILGENWQNFKKGTSRDDIWLWFDSKHSKGVAWLINEK